LTPVPPLAVSLSSQAVGQRSLLVPLKELLAKFSLIVTVGFAVVPAGKEIGTHELDVQRLLVK
jgi:hypothetical protein